MLTRYSLSEGAGKLQQQARLLEHLDVALARSGVLAEPVGNQILDRRQSDRPAVLDRQQGDALRIGRDRRTGGR